MHITPFCVPHLIFYWLIRNLQLLFRGTVYHREKDCRDRDLDEQDLKWKFEKLSGKNGVYRDFATLPSDQTLVSACHQSYNVQNTHLKNYTLFACSY